jgi:hypothetical protein
LRWAEIEKEQTDFVDQVTDELLKENAPVPHNACPIGAPNATSGKPFHIPSRSSRTHDAPAWQRACGDGFPCVSGGRSARGCGATIETQMSDQIIIQHRTTMARRLCLARGEAMPWHRDPFQRVTRLLFFPHQGVRRGFWPTDCKQHLDSLFGPEAARHHLIFSSIVFENARIICNRGPLKLDGVYFINCTFELQNNEPSKKLVETLLAAPAAVTYSTPN